MKPKIPQLVLPGGDLERVKIAFLYGADAVYVGLDKYSLRKAEVRFDINQVGEAIAHAHSLGRKLYVTFNIFAHNRDLKDLESDMKKIAKFQPDAFIISDPGVIAIAQKAAPNVPIHLSTQANTVNAAAVKFWQKQGLKRIVLGREVTLSEMTEIKEAVPEMELEIFAHGAMCISYSGRCLLSSYMAGRQANLGECAQPCRWNYNVYLEEKLRPGELMEISEDERGAYVMSSKDLNLSQNIEEISKAGVDALKIEGRNKSEYYLATVSSAYRKALDLFSQNKYDKKAKKEIQSELAKISHREYSTGFLYGKAKKGETYDGRSNDKTWNLLGMITGESDSKNIIIVNNKIVQNDTVEILTPNGIFKDKIKAIFEENSKEIAQISPGKKDQKALISLFKIYPPQSFFRKKI